MLEEVEVMVVESKDASQVMMWLSGEPCCECGRAESASAHPLHGCRRLLCRSAAVGSWRQLGNSA